METVEQQIQRVGATTAPRITPADIEATIKHEIYFNAGDAALIYAAEIPRNGPLPVSAASLKCLTICVLVLANGYTVVGKSACASPENYNEEVGRRVSREDAVRQIWALEGYALRSKLAV